MTPAEVRLIRVLPGPVDRVWRYLTDPSLRATWLAGGDMELRVGARFDLRYDHGLISSEPVPPAFRAALVGHHETGEITACDPPRLLAFTWGETRGTPSQVTIELLPYGEDTRLVLTHRQLPPGTGSLAVTGWHAHVDALTDRLRDQPVRPFWTNYERLSTRRTCASVATNDRNRSWRESSEPRPRLAPGSIA